MSKHIVYQILEEKYIPSALECLILSRTQKGALFSDLGCDDSMVRKFSTDTFTGNLENQRRTLIAIDTTKENHVVGVIPGVDFCDYVTRLRSPSNIEEVNVQKMLDLKSLEPFLKQNIKFGKVIAVSGLGVRSGYNGLGIAQNLTSLFKQNSRGLGYQSMIGIAYNPASFHIFIKLGWKVYSHVRVSEIQELSQDYKKRLSKDNFYVIGENTFSRDLYELPREVHYEYEQHFQPRL